MKQIKQMKQIKELKSKNIKTKSKSKNIKTKSNLIEADFKTVKEKFLKQDRATDEVDDYIDRFKKLRDQNRIQKNEEKDIDYWGKKDFDDFAEFIDELEGTPSKTQIRKAPWKMATPEGSEKVGENSNWIVYKVITFEAAEKLGTPNWCISRSKSHWDSLNKKSSFYFLLSKTRSYNIKTTKPDGHIVYEDNWHRIALGIHNKGEKTYWDADDKSHDNPPGDLNLEKDFPDVEFEPNTIYRIWVKSDMPGMTDWELVADSLEEAVNLGKQDIVENKWKWFKGNEDSEAYLNKSVNIIYEITDDDGEEVYARGVVVVEGEYSKLRKAMKLLEDNTKTLAHDPVLPYMLIRDRDWYWLVEDTENKDGGIWKLTAQQATCFLLQFGAVEPDKKWVNEEANEAVYKYKNKYYYVSFDTEEFISRLELFSKHPSHSFDKNNLSTVYDANIDYGPNSFSTKMSHLQMAYSNDPRTVSAMLWVLGVIVNPNIKGADAIYIDEQNMGERRYGEYAPFYVDFDGSIYMCTGTCRGKEITYVHKIIKKFSREELDEDFPGNMVNLMDKSITVLSRRHPQIM